MKHLACINYLINVPEDKQDLLCRLQGEDNVVTLMHDLFTYKQWRKLVGKC